MGLGRDKERFSGGLGSCFSWLTTSLLACIFHTSFPRNFEKEKGDYSQSKYFQLTYPYLGFFFKWSYSMHLCCMLVRLDHRLQVLGSSNLWQQKAVMCSLLWISCVSGWPVHHQTSGMETFSKEQSEHVYYIDLAKAKSEASICVLLITENQARRGGGYFVRGVLQKRD